MTDLVDEERRPNDYRAFFSSQDATRMPNLKVAAHHCAITRSNLRRRLSPDPGNMQPARIGKRQIDAFAPIFCSTPVACLRAESVRRVPAGDIPPIPLHRAVQACVRSRVAPRTEPAHSRAR